MAGGHKDSFGPGRLPSPAGTPHPFTGQMRGKSSFFTPEELSKFPKNIQKALHERYARGAMKAYIRAGHTDPRTSGPRPSVAPSKDSGGKGEQPRDEHGRFASK